MRVGGIMFGNVQCDADRYFQRLRQMRFLTVNAGQDINDEVVHFERQAIGHKFPVYPRDQRAKIAVGNNKPRASSRTANSPNSTLPPISRKCESSSASSASADIRTA